MEKIHLLSPLNVGKKLLTDFKKKASVFNKIFGWNYTLITKGSSLPSLLNPNLKSNISFINFTDNYILKIISLLILMVVIMMIMMAHGHYDTSIRITKICGKTILETLSKIYRS